jgi:hypothetical protein
VKTAAIILAGLPLLALYLSAIVAIYRYFTGDRSGNSGRMTHIDNNPRIKNCKGE